jgi:hypothetical protein|tara:strand:- start:348 stop:587 length:240 start_codon:yes stop_codon:yes gene_type:complete
MNNNKNLLDSVIGVFGVIASFAILYNTIKTIANNTETNVISDNALEAIQNPEEAIKLRKAIDSYHETGDWSKTDISKIL